MAEAEPFVSFSTKPQQLRHWGLSVDGAVATLTMQVSPSEGLRADEYELKLNSYDLSVDIELADIVTRLRFEHPEVKAVVVTGGLDKVFCAGANIAMLRTSSHAHKVNFCKLTNETRNTIEEAGTFAGQGWIAAVNGTAAGGGYELALACDEIVMIDDRSSSVSLPEVPLLAVLPGTGGLTRLVDKRFVRPRPRRRVFYPNRRVQSTAGVGVATGRPHRSTFGVRECRTPADRRMGCSVGPPQLGGRRSAPGLWVVNDDHHRWIIFNVCRRINRSRNCCGKHRRTWPFGAAAEDPRRAFGCGLRGMGASCRART